MVALIREQQVLGEYPQPILSPGSIALQSCIRTRLEPSRCPVAAVLPQGATGLELPTWHTSAAWMWLLSLQHLLVVPALTPLLRGISVAMDNNAWLSSFSNGQPAGESSAHPESSPGPAQNHSDYHEIPLCLPQSVSRLPSEQWDQAWASDPEAYL